MVTVPDPAAMMGAREVVISRLGAQGDGIADGDGHQLFVPFTLPGEKVSVASSAGRLRAIDVLTASPDRVTPVCRHFGTCGGCALQHMSMAAYRAWKSDQVAAAFRARGIDANVQALITPEGLRRRAVLTATRFDTAVSLGFHEAASHRLIDLAECPVLDHRIVAAMPGLRTLIAPLISKRGEAKLTVTLTRAGLDVAIDGIERKMTADVRARIAVDAAASKLARVSIDLDPVYQASPPFLTFGTVDVLIPPGTFVQAVADAETKIASMLAARIGKSKSVADLFCGIGSLTFPLAAHAKVLAVDSDQVAIGALAAAVKTATRVKPVTTLIRDLFREPLSALELSDFDTVVFDPPRAGAEAQARMLAKSKVKTVLAVSCNPATLARDARTLIDGGYKLESVTPIDQFLYTPHVEAVAVFLR